MEEIAAIKKILAHANTNCHTFVDDSLIFLKEWPSEKKKKKRAFNQTDT